MSDIRPIETQYRGYRFRSRLEARWAVFFDRCDVRYDYEPEGFELPSGRYLPDFYFRWGEFLEVKPAGLLPKRHFEFDQALSYPIRDDLPREIILGGELYRALGSPDRGDSLWRPIRCDFFCGERRRDHSFTKRGPRVGTERCSFLLISCGCRERR